MQPHHISKVTRSHQVFCHHGRSRVNRCKCTIQVTYAGGNQSSTATVPRARCKLFPLARWPTISEPKTKGTPYQVSFTSPNMIQQMPTAHQEEKEEEKRHCYVMKSKNMKARRYAPSHASGIGDGQENKMALNWKVERPLRLMPRLNSWQDDFVSCLARNRLKMYSASRISKASPGGATGNGRGDREIGVEL